MQQVYSRDIYHGLPVFPDAEHGLSAIITGANGISGHYMLRVLSQSPQRWTKIYCLSRRPPYISSDTVPISTNVEHIAVDFLQEPEKIAATLQGSQVQATHVFFFSYLQPPPRSGRGLWSDAPEMTRVNTILLNNFLKALTLAKIQPRRFMLQTGAKHYGGHLGPTKVPQEESDPRIEIDDEPNFYYPQEDALSQYCGASGGRTQWNVLMPGPVLGAVPDAAMNLAFPLAVYATVCRVLHEPLQWPGDASAWQMHSSMSSAMMNAYMEEWAVLTPAAANQRFNACDGGAFTWEGFWPKLAAWYDVDWTGPQDGTEYVETMTLYNPRGYGGRGVSRRTFTMVAWAKQEKVRNAWSNLAVEHGLTTRELGDVDRIFGFLDGALCRSSPLMFSVDKARKLGWHGFVDTADSLLAVFTDLARIKMIPPMPDLAATQPIQDTVAPASD